MKRLTISVEDDQYAEIEHEADERGVFEVTSCEGAITDR